MSNYLPVLLSSVTNAAPDDSSLAILPRGQVDYLSHEWREEDVWRSWRNMTRQKNEIANGMRLENASWRTWWKQRNKLKTITPETLNWLKDSDVTWLYGPLHTAVDWSPPPKPKPDPTEVGRDNPAQDRLDLSLPYQSTSSHRFSSGGSDSKSPSPTPYGQYNASHGGQRYSERAGVRKPTGYKPILKHRSISEMLTADLAPSPIFSPVESEDENMDAIQEDEDEGQESHDKTKRPPLLHTRSDTHVTRWGPGRAFRKDSPPRVHPPSPNSEKKPGPSSSSSTTSSSSNGAKALKKTSSKTNLYSYFNPSPGSQPTPSSSSTHHSVNFSATPQGHSPHHHGVYKDGSTPGSTHSTSSAGKKKHISFNTFVEQCIAIEKPQKKSSPSGVVFSTQAVRYGGGEDWYDDDDDDVRAETGAGHVWHRSTSSMTGDSDSDSVYEDDSDGNSRPNTDSNANDADVIHMRTHSPSTTHPPLLPDSSSTQSNNSESTPSSSTPSTPSPSPETVPEASDEVHIHAGYHPSSTVEPQVNSYLYPDDAVKRSSKKRRSKSKLSTTSSSSSTSGASLEVDNNADGESGRRKTRTRSGTMVRAPGSMLRTSSLGMDREPLTIAPIAPTLLKTGGNGQEFDSDEEERYANGGGGAEYDGQGEGWVEKVGGNDYQGWLSDVHTPGLAGYDSKKDGKKKGKNGYFGADTEVELVYVPPIWRGYDYDVERDEEDEDDEEDEEDEEEDSGEERVFHHMTTQSQDMPMVGVGGGITVTPPSPVRNKPTTAVSIPSSQKTPTSASPHTPYDTKRDAYDFFEGPDLGEDFGGRRKADRTKDNVNDAGDDDDDGINEDTVLTFGSPLRRYPSSGNRGSTSIASRKGGVLEDSSSTTTAKDGGRRGRSHSHTPSPSRSPIKSAAVNVPKSNGGSSFEQGNSSPSTVLLSPPLRGRGPASPSSEGGTQPRGRSSTRTSSTSLSDRERSGAGSFGSLSPEGSSIGLAGAYAGSRVDKAAAERERERGRSRRGGNRSLSESKSPEDRSVSDSRSSNGSSAATIVPSSPSSSSRPGNRSTSGFDGHSQAVDIPSPIAEVDLVEELEASRSRNPTPSNSPVRGLAMKSSAPSSSLGTASTNKSTQNVPAKKSGRSPVSRTSKSPASPTTNKSPVSPSTNKSPVSPSTIKIPTSPTSPKDSSSPSRSRRSPSEENPENASIVGRIVSAGAYFGLWNGGSENSS